MSLMPGRIPKECRRIWKWFFIYCIFLWWSNECSVFFEYSSLLSSPLHATLESQFESNSSWHVTILNLMDLQSFFNWLCYRIICNTLQNFTTKHVIGLALILWQQNCFHCPIKQERKQSLIMSMFRVIRMQQAYMQREE